jgi:hypothetical protein
MVPAPPRALDVLTDNGFVADRPTGTLRTRRSVEAVRSIEPYAEQISYWPFVTLVWSWLVGPTR